VAAVIVPARFGGPEPRLGLIRISGPEPGLRLVGIGRVEGRLRLVRFRGVERWLTFGWLGRVEGGLPFPGPGLVVVLPLLGLVLLAVVITMRWVLVGPARIIAGVTGTHVPPALRKRRLVPAPA